MKSSMVRKLDSLGRIVIPSEVRVLLHLHTMEQLEFFYDEEAKALCLQKLEYTCVFCDERTELSSFEGKLVCTHCRKDLSRLLPENCHSLSGRLVRYHGSFSHARKRTLSRHFSK